MALGDVYSIKFWQQVQGEHFVNRFFYVETQVCFNQRPAERLAIRFKQIVVPSYAACLSEFWSATLLDTGRVTGLKVPRDQELCDEVGGVDATAGPLNAPVVVNLNTGTGTPSGQGRVYISGIAADHASAGLVRDVWLTLAEPLRQNLTEPLTSTLAGGGQWKLCLFSPELETPQLVRVVAYRPNLGSMKTRRRRPQIAQT